jgi:transcriptional regulator with XRE-family HTH domain
MTNRTDFGRACQTFREHLGMPLLRFAESLGVSPSFVCAVEIGQKNAPDGYVEKAIQTLGLDASAAERLKNRELRSRASFKIENVNPQEAQLLAAFISNRSSLGARQIEAATVALQQSFDFCGVEDEKE